MLGFKHTDASFEGHGYNHWANSSGSNSQLHEVYYTYAHALCKSASAVRAVFETITIHKCLLHTCLHRGHIELRLCVKAL